MIHINVLYSISKFSFIDNENFENKSLLKTTFYEMHAVSRDTWQGLQRLLHCTPLPRAAA